MSPDRILLAAAVVAIPLHGVSATEMQNEQTTRLAECTAMRGAGDIRWLNAVIRGETQVLPLHRLNAANNAFGAAVSGCEVGPGADLDEAAKAARRIVAAKLGNAENLPRQSDSLADCLARDAQLESRLYLAVADRYGIRADAEQSTNRLQAMAAMLSKACHSQFSALGSRLQENELYSRLNWLLRAQSIFAAAPAAGAARSSE